VNELLRTTEVIAELVLKGVCPILVLLDLSYAGAKRDFDKVFEWCTTWWLTLSDLPWPTLIEELPGRITRVFEILYGERHLSFKCAFRSLLSSLLAISIMSAVINAIDMSGIGARDAASQTLDAIESVAGLLGQSGWMIGLGILLTNLVVDYVSLLETRWILSRVEPQSAPRTIVLTVIDYVLTTWLWVGAFALLIMASERLSSGATVPTPELIQGVWSAAFFPVLVTIEWFRGGSVASGQGVALGHLIALFAGSTYFTSVVFYLFATTSLALRFSRASADRLAGLLAYYVETKLPRPLTLLAVVLGVLSQALVAVLRSIVAVYLLSGSR